MEAPNPLSKKLQIKPKHRVVLLGAPPGIEALLAPLPEGAGLSSAARGRFDVVMLFVTNAKALDKGAPKAIGALEDGGVFWICYPKKGSGVVTDLNRDCGWSVVEEAGFGPVAQCAIDEIWSALRFKPEASVSRKSGSVVAPGAAKKAPSKKSAPIAPPSDLAEKLATSGAARATWDGLSPSHRKEYVGWIEEAKRPETRARRLDKTVEMLAAGVRDRNEKYAG